MNDPSELRGLDLDGAADAIEDWGFVAGGRPLGDPRAGYLVVALRDRPTLDHFDPESVRFWTGAGDHAERWQLDRHSAVPWEADLSWGPIRITDRLRVHNDHLTFGGVVTAARAADTLVTVFLSPAPLLRAGGHSQAWDPGAAEVWAFFGRLAAAAGSDPSRGVRIARADPLARYAAFVADALAHPTVAARAPVGRSMASLLRTERERLERLHPDAWRVGSELLPRP